MRSMTDCKLQFQCCGYLNSTSPAFITDEICPSPAAAALLRGCATNVASFANAFINDLFTAVFGMVGTFLIPAALPPHQCHSFTSSRETNIISPKGIDALLILSIACLVKERKEMERYYIIDQKRDYGRL